MIIRSLSWLERSALWNAVFMVFAEFPSFTTCLLLKENLMSSNGLFEPEIWRKKSDWTVVMGDVGLRQDRKRKGSGRIGYE